MVARRAAIAGLLLLAGGCQSGGRGQVQRDLDANPLTPATAPDSAGGLEVALQTDEDVEARVAPPQGWLPDPLKSSNRHRHRVWLSPDRRTAYGVIRFNLPLPVGADLALIGFMSEMRRSEGEATLIDRRSDPSLPGLRFVAEGGRYRMRVNLITRGMRGWAVYAGTLVHLEEDPAQLEQAEAARERTLVGLERD